MGVCIWLVLENASMTNLAKAKLQGIDIKVMPGVNKRSEQEQSLPSLCVTLQNVLQRVPCARQKGPLQEYEGGEIKKRLVSREESEEEGLDQWHLRAGAAEPPLHDPGAFHAERCVCLGWVPCNRSDARVAL